MSHVILEIYMPNFKLTAIVTLRSEVHRLHGMGPSGRVIRGDRPRVEHFPYFDSAIHERLFLVCSI